MPSPTRLVVIGASAGGPDALRQLFGHYPGIAIDTTRDLLRLKWISVSQLAFH